MIGQVTPMLNPPEDLENYVPEEDKVKILRPENDVVSGQFLELVETLAYLTVRGDERGSFFGYGHDKDNSKILYSVHKTKIPNYFNAIIFDRHKNSIRLELFQIQIFLKHSFFIICYGQERRHC